jgi:hypothetical protein
MNGHVTVKVNVGHGLGLRRLVIIIMNAMKKMSSEKVETGSYDQNTKPNIEKYPVMNEGNEDWEP